MIKVGFIFTLILVLNFSSCTTRYYILRHAEKVCADCDTCKLNDTGRVSALLLKNFFKNKKIDTIFASQCLRTIETAKPVADYLHKTISVYQTNQLDEFIAHLKKLNKKQVLIITHLNLIPILVDSLSGFHIPPISPDKFHNIYIVEQRRFIKKSVKLISITYIKQEL
jgi:broad specificity phosphatase PhoE